MIKKFSKEEMKQMGIVKSKEIEEIYRNKYIIMVDCSLNFYTRNGEDIQFGMKGYLYAIGDLEDKEEIYKLTSEAADEYDCISSYGNFAIRDGRYYVS
jgi:hypothetical protein